MDIRSPPSSTPVSSSPPVASTIIIVPVVVVLLIVVTSSITMLLLLPSARPSRRKVVLTLKSTLVLISHGWVSWWRRRWDRPWILWIEVLLLIESHWGRWWWPLILTIWWRRWGREIRVVGLLILLKWRRRYRWRLACRWRSRRQVRWS